MLQSLFKKVASFVIEHLWWLLLHSGMKVIFKDDESADLHAFRAAKKPEAAARAAL